MSRLVLAVGPGPDHTGRPPAALTPVVDGIGLIDRVTAFEQAMALEPAGGYAGLVPGSVGMTEPRRYYLHPGTESGRTWLLGCDCGEAGCWPLAARVQVTAGTVTWSDVGQPHRPGRDYRGFGPFVFPRPGYERALREAEAVLAGHRPDRPV